MSGLTPGATDDDSFVLRVLYRPLAGPIVLYLAARGARPNTITALAFATTLASAAVATLGAYPCLLAAAVLLQIGLVLDCVDGGVARVSGRTSSRGAVLDIGLDRYADAAVIVALVMASGEAQRYWPWTVGAIVGSLIGPYVTALAKVHGLPVRRLVKRTERLVFCSIGMAFGLPLVAVLVLAIAVNGDTLVGLVHVLRAADGQLSPAGTAPPATDPDQP
jgi:phosphatidylglycerophosphate synthase